MTILEAQKLEPGEVYLVAFGDWLYVAVFEGTGDGGKLRWTTHDMGTVDAWAEEAELVKLLGAG